MEPYRRLIERLEEEQKESYEEDSLLLLAQAYLLCGEEKAARKTVRRLLRLFPSGEKLVEAEELSDALSNGEGERYKQRLLEQLPEGLREEPVRRRGIAMGLSEMFQRIRRKKRPVHIPENIRECFDGAVGLESVQKDLQQFYIKLRFQNEREQNDFQAQLLPSTNFAVTGSRGCGKTMVGEIIASLLYDFGVRGEDHAVKVEARELLKAASEDGADGVKQLFSELSDVAVILENIQEALGEGDAPRKEASEILFALKTIMRERGNDLSLILTGSKAAMDGAFLLEDDLRDCIYREIDIPPYSMEELLELADKLAGELALRIHPDAREMLAKRLRMELASPDFMNAVTIRRILLEASDRLARRYYEESDGSEEDMVYLRREDFEQEIPQESLDELLEQVDSLTGLGQFKAQLRRQIETEAALKVAEEHGLNRSSRGGSMHMVFAGNPGTGKTTAARLTGRIYQQLGLLPRGNVTVECSRSDLVGMYQGHTAPLVRGKFREAAGGVLFIDEAYSLCRGDKDDFGHEAVDELIKCMEDYRTNTMVILAGYTREMEEFLKSNPGFASRIPRQNHILFEDYTVSEMEQIFCGMARGAGYELDEEARPLLHSLLDMRSRESDFGNARGVRNIFGEVEAVINGRIVQSTENLSRITTADLETMAGSITENEGSLEELLGQLVALTGLAMVKEKIQRTIDRIQVEQFERKQGIAGKTSQISLHMVFTGNAGTGKTTVARLIGKIYRKLGVLENGRFREVGRSDLVGQYLGETAIKVNKVVRDCLGGILFIDEAYSLINGDRDTFGREAVNALVQEIENNRSRLMVIIAGYTKDMESFMEANQGLASRFPESGRIFFEDYSDDELLEIFIGMVAEKGYTMEEGLEPFLREYIAAKRASVRDFGNARGVRNLVETAVERRGSRIAALLREGRELSDKELRLLVREDFA